MPEINVTVKCSNDTKYTIPIDTEKTVLEFKEAIAAKADTPADRQRLIYSGRVLKDEQVLDTYKIQEGHTVHMVKGAAPAGSTSTPSTTTPAAATVPQNMQSGQQVNNPLASLAGAFPGGAFPGGANPFAMLGGSGGPSGPAADPNAIANMFANPQFAQTMSSMLSNPQVLDSIINMNPQLRSMGPEVRQMMQSEEFRRAMSDPNTLRNMAQMSAAMGQMGGGMPGMPGMPGMGGSTPSFPAPGATNTTPSSTTESTGATSPSAGAAPVNPFASLLNPAAGGNVPTSSPFGGGAGGAGGFDPAMFETYMRTMGGMGGMGGGLGGMGGLGGTVSPGTPPTPADNRPPEERFQQQLQQLNDMGFWEASSNIRALQMTGGNVSAAIEYLLSNPGPGA